MQPTVLFIHGAWHSPNHFKRVRDLFEANGFPTSCPSQPTFGGPPSMKMYEDAECIRLELKRLIEDEGKDVIIVMHSYGGVVGTEAVHESFAKEIRGSKRLPGGVLHLLYMCAFVLPLGDSLGSAFGGKLPPFIVTEVGGPVWPFVREKRAWDILLYASLTEHMGIVRTTAVATCWSQSVASITIFRSRNKITGSRS